MENYYNILSVSRFNFSKEKLETRYSQLISGIERDYTVYRDNPEMIMKINELRGKIEEAYIVLSDDEKRKNYEKLLNSMQVEKNKEESKTDSFREQMKYIEENNNSNEEYGEKYSARRLYDKNAIKDVEYKKYKDAKRLILRYEQTENGNTRFMDLTINGIISYSTPDSKKYDRLLRVEVTTYVLGSKEVKKYMVITPFMDIDKLIMDEEYKKTVCEKLFSEENLMKAKYENYGYLGKLDREDGESVITYNKRDFSASVKFDRELRKDIDKKNDSKENER